jgi:hypothetical protein
MGILTSKIEGNEVEKIAITLNEPWYKKWWAKYIIWPTFVGLVVGLVLIFFSKKTTNQEINTASNTGINNGIVAAKIENFTVVSSASSTIEDFPGSSINIKLKNYLNNINTEIVSLLSKNGEVATMLTNEQSKPLLSIRQGLFEQGILSIEPNGNQVSGINAGANLGLSDNLGTGEERGGFTLTALENF